jgi:hypothetical protein
MLAREASQRPAYRPPIQMAKGTARAEAPAVPFLIGTTLLIAARRVSPQSPAGPAESIRLERGAQQIALRH